MTVRSSEVLRLAAEYAFQEQEFTLLRACGFFNIKPDHANEVLHYALECDFDFAKSGEQKCMALCLAAAIAEDAGD